MRMFDLSPTELADHVDDAYWADQGQVERVSDPDLLTQLRVLLRGRPELAEAVEAAWLDAHDSPVDADERGHAAHWYARLLDQAPRA